MTDIILPSVLISQVDDVVETAAIYVISPADLQTGLPTSTTISFTVIDMNAAPIDALDVVVTANGLAPTSTSFVAVGTNILNYTATFAAFAQDSTIAVAATYDDGVTNVSKSWSFTTEDTVQPQLVNATATSTKQIELVFDDDMTFVDATNFNDTLNATNYEIRRTQAPSVSVVVVSAEQGIDTKTVILTTDIELTFGASYIVNVQGVEDSAGNIIDPAFTEVSFSAFLPDFPQGRSFLVWNMFSDLNKKEDITNDLKKMCAVIQEVTNLMMFEIDSFSSVIDPDLADEETLEQMLCDLGASPSLLACMNDTVQAKRNLVGSIVSLYKLKGTEPGLIAAAKTLMGLTITIDVFNNMTDVWQLGVSTLGVNTNLGPSGRELYTFNVETDTPLSDEQIACLNTIIKVMKPAHTHLGRVIEPNTIAAETPNHWQLGFSELGINTILH